MTCPRAGPTPPSMLCPSSETHRAHALPSAPIPDAARSGPLSAGSSLGRRPLAREAGPGPHAPCLAIRERGLLPGHPGNCRLPGSPGPWDKLVGPMVCTGPGHPPGPRTPAGGAPAALLSASSPFAPGAHTHMDAQMHGYMQAHASLDTLRLRHTSTRVDVCTHRALLALAVNVSAHHSQPEAWSLPGTVSGLTPALVLRDQHFGSTRTEAGSPELVRTAVTCYHSVPTTQAEEEMILSKPWL